MGLRSTLYLDFETLLAQAEYHDLDFPRGSAIVEKSIRNREGNLKVGYGPLAVGGAAANNVEFQSSYSLEPKEKATTSKVIDSLFEADVVKIPAGDVSLWKDDLVEVEGTVTITAVSMVGKLFYLMRKLLESEGTEIDSLDDLDFKSPAVQTGFKELYLRNAVPPIPLLVKVSGSSYKGGVYASLDPGHFVGSAAQDLIEGNHRILGSVRQVVPGGDEGFLATDPWLLAGWEHFVRRTLMAQLGDQVEAITKEFDIAMPKDDAYGWIKGPALLLDAIAIY